MLPEYRQINLGSFVADSERLRRRIKFIAFLPAIMFGVPMVLALPFLDHVRAYFMSLQQSGNGFWIPIMFLGWMAAVIVAVGVLERRTRMDSRVRCPSCG